MKYANNSAKKGRETYKKQRRLSHDNPIFLLNLKSNTMKNTVQKYCFFCNPPNIFTKKCYKTYFCYFQFAKLLIQEVRAALFGMLEGLFIEPFFNLGLVP